MIIDFHTHTYPDSISKKVISMLSSSSGTEAASDGTVNGLIGLMEKYHIDKSIVLPVITNPLRVTSINDYSIKMNNSQNKLIYFGGMHPDYNDIDAELFRLKENGIKGIKLHPEYQSIPVDDERTIKTIDLAFKYDLIVVIHAGFDPAYIDRDYSSVDRIINMLNKLTNKGKLVLAHLGGLKEWDEVYEKIAGKDVYLDTAMSLYDDIHTSKYLSPIDEDLFYKLIKKHGTNKILFGSDNPWIDPSYIIDYIDKLDLTTEIKSKIFYKNALKLLGVIEDESK